MDKIVAFATKLKNLRKLGLLVGLLLLTQQVKGFVGIGTARRSRHFK